MSEAGSAGRGAHRGARAAGVLLVLALLAAASALGQPLAPATATTCLRDLLDARRYDDVIAIGRALAPDQYDIGERNASLELVAAAHAAKGDHARARETLATLLASDPDWQSQLPPVAAGSLAADLAAERAALAQRTTDRALEAQAIGYIERNADLAVSGGCGSNGLLLVRVVSLRSQLMATTHPLWVRRCDGGRWAASDEARFQRAIGEDRAEWPSRMIVFSVEACGANLAVLRYRTMANGGFTPRSRGGESRVVVLDRHRPNESGWSVVRMAID